MTEKINSFLGQSLSKEEFSRFEKLENDILYQGKISETLGPILFVFMMIYKCWVPFGILGAAVLWGWVVGTDLPFVSKSDFEEGDEIVIAMFVLSIAGFLFALYWIQKELVSIRQLRRDEFSISERYVFFKNSKHGTGEIIDHTESNFVKKERKDVHIFSKDEKGNVANTEYFSNVDNPDGLVQFLTNSLHFSLEKKMK